MRKRKTGFINDSEYKSISPENADTDGGDDFPGFDIPDEFNTPYEEYEALIIRKEQLTKIASSRRVDYLQHFGDLMAEILTTKLECIRLKKILAYCTRCINLGEPIDTNAMQQEIDGEMQAYYVELQNMLDERDGAKNARLVDEYDVRMSKQIFRRICKRLHPDINTKTSKNGKLMDLWNRVMEAYKEYDAEKLEELEVELNHIMTLLGEEGFAPNIDNIDEKIKKIQKRISAILTTEPYTYGKLLADPKAIDAKKQELNKQLEEFKEYKRNLEEELEKLTGEGGARFTWQMTL
ncbi:MAG: hypothetical protein IKN45_07665 [Lachnospiraceae bacterium]|nr:hypothetical protein [Lachnospiraceae bacterium]